MNLRCIYCQTMFTLNRDTMLYALQTMQGENLSHFDAHCPRCRRANPISRGRLELAMPGWRNALAPETNVERPAPVAPAQPASIPVASAPVAVAAPMSTPQKAAPAVKRHAPASVAKKPAAKPSKPAKAPASKKPVKPVASKSAKKPATKKPAAKAKSTKSSEPVAKKKTGRK